MYEGREYASSFGHTFGGTVESHGIRVKNTKAPIQLLFDLDLSDPAIDVKIPGVNRLPLLYGLHYAGQVTDQRYIVHPDRSVEFFGLKRYSPDYVLECPDAFPETSLSLERAGFDSQKAEDALSCLQVFGLRHLPALELERAITLAYDKYWPELSERKNQFEHKDLTKQEYLESEAISPFWQHVNRFCDNPRCSSITYKVTGWIPFKVRGFMRKILCRGDWPIARDISRQESLREIGMWEFEHQELLVIFSHCPLCNTIHVTNQTS